MMTDIWVNQRGYSVLHISGDMPLWFYHCSGGVLSSSFLVPCQICGMLHTLPSHKQVPRGNWESPRLPGNFRDHFCAGIIFVYGPRQWETLQHGSDFKGYNSSYNFAHAWELRYNGMCKFVKSLKHLFFTQEQHISGFVLRSHINSLRPSDAYICISKLTIIGSDNSLSPGQHQAIIWTNAGYCWLGP